MPYKTVHQILELAKGAEDQARQFYEQAASLVQQGGQAETLLRDLAREERKHFEMLEMFDPGITGRAIVPFEPELIGEFEDALAQLSAASSPEEVCELALKREEAMAAFYGQIARSVDSDAVSELFSSLQTYELGHIDLVNTTCAYYRSNRESGQR